MKKTRDEGKIWQHHGSWYWLQMMLPSLILQALRSTWSIRTRGFCLWVFTLTTKTEGVGRSMGSQIIWKEGCVDVGV